MMFKRSFSILFLFGLSILFGQSLSSYKYLETPYEMQGFKKENQYGLVTYAKNEFEKNGFILLPLNSKDWPAEARNNPCLVLTLKVSKLKSVFKNKLNTELINCNNEVVKSNEGISSTKDYKLGFREAIKEAIGKYSLSQYSFDKALALKPVKEVSESYEKLTEPNLSNSTVVVSEAKKAREFFANNLSLVEELINEQKVIFVDKSNPNKIVVRGAASSLKGVYRVTFSDAKNEIYSTIGYFENGNWVMDLKNENGNWNKTVFSLK